MTKIKTFTLYLVKDGVKGFEDVFTDSAKERIKAGDAILIETNKLGDIATIYVFENIPRPPTWLADVSTVFEGLPDVRNKTSCSVVVFSYLDRMFITSFAHGWQYIDDNKIESDFGLRVTINSLDDRKVKRIDSSHLGAAMKGVSQSAFQRDLQSFGIDEALDLVRRITGRTENDDFANSLAGSTSLKITREMNFSDLPEVAGEALTRFKSEEYKKTGFHIIDKVRPVLDRMVLAKLDSEAVEVIKNGNDNFELSMPGWSEDDVVYYGLFGPGLKGRFPDLLMANYREALGKNIVNLDVHSIVSKHGVLAEFNNDFSTKKRWSIKKALIGSLNFDGGLYAISEGDWYRLDKQFKVDVDASFNALIKTWNFEPEKIIKMISEDGKKTGYESELAYNERCAKSYNQICLDQKILMVPSIPYGKFEACDLLDIENKKLIHVKKSSRQSSVLSHFFKQGSNSARILKLFPEARSEMIEKVRKTEGDAKANELKTAFGDAVNDWIVEFHIIDSPRADGSFTIPFFSRITLRDEARALKGMTFDVSVKFIQN